MEGFLYKWNGVVSRWKKHYFKLIDEILSFSRKPETKRKGTIHLKISRVSTIPNDHKNLINFSTKSTNLNFNSDKVVFLLIVYLFKNMLT